MKRNGPRRSSSRKKPYKCKLKGQAPCYFLARQNTGMQGCEYSKEKIKHLLSKESTELIHLFESLPKEVRKRFLLEDLPPDGAFVEKDLDSLYKRLSRWQSYLTTRNHGYHEHAWHIYAHLLVTWIHEQQELNDLLAEFTYEIDSGEEEQGKDSLKNRAIDIKCFEYLSLASQQGKITQEIIRTFYEYGYFLPEQTIEDYIRTAKSEIELGASKKLNQVAENIVQLEKIYGSKFKEQEDSLKAISAELHTLQKDIKGNFLKVENQCNQLLTQTDEFLTLKLLQPRLEQLSKSIETIKTQSDSKWQTSLQSHKQSLSKDMEMIVELCGGYENKIEQLANKILLIENKVEELSNIDRVQLLEGLSSEFSLTPPSFETTFLSLKEVSETTENTLILNSLEDLEAILFKNLANLGIIKADAKRLTKNILAALYSGNLILFKGAFSNTIVKIVAKSLTALSNFEIEIPVGLFESQQVSTCFEKALRATKSRETMSSLIFYGMNRSGVEIYGDKLEEIMGNRFLGIDEPYGKIFLLGTLSDGPAALPISPQLSQYGPIFDLTNLKWNLKTAIRPTNSALTIANWTEIRDKIYQSMPETPANMAELQEIAIELQNGLLERNLQGVLTTLSAMYEDGSSRAELSALFNHWIKFYTQAKEIKHLTLEDWQSEFTVQKAVLHEP